jgi:hypothetical protein
LEHAVANSVINQLVRDPSPATAGSGRLSDQRLDSTARFFCA